MKRLLISLSILAALSAAAAYGQVPINASTVSATVSLGAPVVATNYGQVNGQPAGYSGNLGFTSYGKNGTGDFDFVAANSGASPSFEWYFLLGSTVTQEMFLDQNANLHVPNGGVTSLSVTSATSVNPHTYTVATLPGASVVGVGGMVIVSDGNNTVGTCTGGGSTFMIAVSTGSAWSCR